MSKPKTAARDVIAKLHAQPVQNCPKACDDAIRALRSLPLNQRAEALIGTFAMVVREFASMVLEHVEPPKAPPRERR